MRSSIKVVHMTSVHHPYDPRIFHKECFSLHDAGYNVTLIAQEASLKREVPFNYLPIKKYNSKLKRMIFGSWEVYKKAKKLNADIYHFHDPELMIIARLLKKKNNIVVYDVHEDFITSLVKKDYIKKPIKKLIQFSFRWIEKIFTKKFKKVLAEKYYKDIYPDGECVLNYPVVNERIINHTRKNHATENALIYTGNVDEQRGAFIHSKIPAIHKEVSVFLYGKTPSRFAQKMAEIAGDNKKRLHITGIDQFVEKEEIESAYISRNWLAGLAIFPPTDHYLKKELTKFFEYMSAGIPIICSNFPVWNNFIKKYNCGITVDPYNDDEIFEAIEYLKNNPSTAQKMGQNGKRAVVRRLNWQTEATKLIHLYEDWMQKINR